MPRVTEATSSPLEPTGILGTEFLTPLPDGFVGDDDSALCEAILDVSEAQAEAVVQPDGVADDFGRKTVSAIAVRIAAHVPSLPGPAST